MVDPLSPVFRDGLSGSFAESPLTKQERQLQELEGRPPIEVAPTGAQGIPRRRRSDSDERWRPSGATPRQDGAEEDEPEDSEPGTEEEAESNDAEKTEEESSGHMLDSRS